MTSSEGDVLPWGHRRFLPKSRFRFMQAPRCAKPASRVDQTKKGSMGSKPRPEPLDVGPDDDDDDIFEPGWGDGLGEDRPKSAPPIMAESQSSTLGGLSRKTLFAFFNDPGTPKLSAAGIEDLR